MVNDPRPPDPEEPPAAAAPAAAGGAPDVAAAPAAAPPAGGGALVRRVRDGRGAFVLVALLLGAAVVAPDPVPLGTARLAALVTMVSGASLLVTRMSAADLATASAAAAGAYLGGVGTALLGWPVLAGIPIGAAAGAGVGAVSGALHGRVGRTLGALTSLALAGGVLATVGAWTQGGGVAGFHAVRLIARGGVRTELAVVAVVTMLALVAARAVASSRIAAAAAVAVRAPVLAASLGRHPAVDSAIVGAAAGALLGAGGTVLAAVDGSVVPAAYGLQLAAALALAALLGGAPPLGALVGTLLVWGPSTVWPLVPLVGTAPPLLVAGPVGLLVLALRRGRPLIAPSGRAPSGHAPSGHAPSGHVAPGPRAPAHPVTLQVRGAQTPSGSIDLDVRAGEVVALAGPNGAGKSTLLARIAGQLPDGGAVALVAGPAARGAATGQVDQAPTAERAPHGAVGRARAGIRRTWQRPPDVDAADLAVLTRHDPDAAQAVAWAATTLAADATDPNVQQLLLLAASAPGIALLDEPTEVDAARLNVLVRGLAQAGTGVLVVDHRPEVLAAADRVVNLGAEVSST